MRRAAPEAERQRRITDALERFGWLWAHFRKSIGYHGRYQTAQDGHLGYPDVTAVHPERGLLLFIEVKSDRGKLSPEQRVWLSALGQSAHILSGIPPVPATVKPLSVHLCDSDESERALLTLISDGRLS